jgi:hypothetical protein
MERFADWLSTTGPSVFLQNNNAWAIPTIQSLHIVGIGLVMGSVFLIWLRVFGLAWTDQTLGQTMNRFVPWLTGTLWLMLVTGILMVIGEPVRELVTISFWVKMFLVAVSTAIVSVFQSRLRKHDDQWGEAFARRAAVRGAAVFTFLIFAGIIILGRLIAYDHVWGSWSPAKKA